MLKLFVIAREGNQIELPGALAVTVQVPIAKNLIILPSIEHTVGVFETNTGWIMKPRITDLEVSER